LPKQLIILLIEEQYGKRCKVKNCWKENTAVGFSSMDANRRDMRQFKGD
jgi:hypothetical protein